MLVSWRILPTGNLLPRLLLRHNPPFTLRIYNTGRLLTLSIQANVLPDSRTGIHGRNAHLPQNT